MLKAAQLRVSWEDSNFDALVKQVAFITDMEEAHDLIIALTATGDLPLNSLKKMFPEAF